MHGDNTTALSLIDETFRYAQSEIHVVTGWGIPGCSSLAGIHPEEAFGPAELPDTTPTGRLVHTPMRSGISGKVDPRQTRLPKPSISVRDTPYMRHYLRTVVAAAAFAEGLKAAEGWLREADAFCSAAGERALQRRIRHYVGDYRREGPPDLNGNHPSAPGQTRYYST